MRDGFGRSQAPAKWLVAIGLALPSPFIATHLLRERKLPSFFGLPFPANAAASFERWSPEVFAALLGLFAALSALELFAGYLLWQGERPGAVIIIALLPVEVVFWAGLRRSDPAAHRDSADRVARGRLVGSALNRRLLRIAAAGPRRCGKSHVAE